MANDVPPTSEPLACADVSLDAERLDVYRVAVEFQVLATGLLPGRRWPVLRDQLERASASIALNIAEATGSHYLRVKTVSAKRRSCAPQVAEATSIRSPRRRPFVTWR